MTPCAECEILTISDEMYKDLRSPPLSEEPCLCRDCAETAADEAVEEAFKDGMDLLHERDRIIRGTP